jgi:IS5 family transposase
MEYELSACARKVSWSQKARKRPVLPRTRRMSATPRCIRPKNGNQWYFGMKIHVGADVNSGAVHSIAVIAANTADIQNLPKPLRGHDQLFFADAGSFGDEYKKGSRHLELALVRQRQAQARQKSVEPSTQGFASSRHSEHVLNIFFGSSNARSAFVRPVTEDWRKKPLRLNVLVELAILYLLKQQLMASLDRNPCVAHRGRQTNREKWQKLLS